MARLSLSFLGPFQVTLDGQPVTRFESAKVRALLAYLAVESDHPHARETLAGLFWPDWPQSSALANLRYALSDLRGCIGDRAADPPFLVISREEIGWNPSSSYELDVGTFGQRVSDPGPGSGEDDDVVERLASCVPLYRGSFLEGLSLGDSPAFEEWLRAQREHLEQRFLALLQRLGEHYERAGDYAQAQRYAQRQVELDPLREEAQRRLMRALALGGDRNGALVRYQAYRATLTQELGAEPAPETTALYEQIRSGALVAPMHLRAVGQIQPFVRSQRAPDELRLALPTPEEIPESPRPLFVARDQELAHLDQWLEEALRGQGRVGFVVGEPGSGKTMLLREFAHRAMDAHPELIAAGGTCNAYGGLGDSYLPFVEMLQLLLGDVQAQRAVGALGREHAHRLREVAPEMLDAVLQVGPALIDALLPASFLLERARALPDGVTWEARVQDGIRSRPGGASQVFLFNHVTRVLQAVARKRPLLLVVDDMQWADAASISLLFHLGRQLVSAGLPGPRILILGAYRPEEVAAGRGSEPHPLQAVILELAALWEANTVDLAGAEDRAFVEALVDSQPNRLGPAFRAALYRHTGGHALFTVELLHSLQQRGDLLRDDGMQAGLCQPAWIEGPALDWGRLPKRVEAVIAAHIARLSREDQELLSVASVEGEEFHAEVTARVLQRGEAEVVAVLGGALSQDHRLLRAHSLRWAGEQRFSRYRFRHYLFQHYLYQRLDAVRRAQLHGQVAGALEALGAVASGHPNLSDTTEDLDDNFDDIQGAPEGIASEAQLAWHWEEAGAANKAVDYHCRAYRRAARTSFAYEDILARVIKVLALRSTLPKSPGWLRRQRLIYQSLGWVMGRLKGWRAPECGEGYRKSLEAAEELGDAMIISDELSWSCVPSRACGELDAALAMGERALHLAQGGPEGWVMWVQGELARTLLYRGAFIRAAELLAPLPELLRRTGSIMPWSNSIGQLVVAPWALWCLGYPDQALQVGRATLRMINREGAKFQVGADVMVLWSALCFTERLRRDLAGVEGTLRTLEPLVEEGHCPPNMLPLIAMFQGWVHVERGLLEQGIAEQRQALDVYERDSLSMVPHYKSYLAEALARAGRVDEGLALLEEALEQVERTNERFGEAELWRLKGELLLERPSSQASPSPPAPLPRTKWERGEEEAEACFRRAIEVARGQEARSWELRATTSLARLLRAVDCQRAIHRGREAEAREMLAAIYGRFTEGLDTPDLVEAKALLDDMTANAEDGANRGQ